MTPKSPQRQCTGFVALDNYVIVFTKSTTAVKRVVVLILYRSGSNFGSLLEDNSTVHSIYSTLYCTVPYDHHCHRHYLCRRRPLLQRHEAMYIRM